MRKLEYTYKKNLEQYNEKDLINNIENLKIKLDEYKMDIQKEENNKKNYEASMVELNIIYQNNVDLSKLHQLIQSKINCKNDLLDRIERGQKDLKSANKMRDKYDNILKSDKFLNHEEIEKNHQIFLKTRDDKINDLNKSRDMFIERIVPINESDGDLLLIGNKLSSKLINEQKKYNVINTNIKEINKNIRKSNKSIVKIDNFNDIKNNYDIFLDKQNCYKNMKEQCKKITNDIQIYENKLEKLKTHEYDINCKFCMKSQMTQEKVYFMDIIKENIGKLALLTKDANILENELNNNNIVLQYNTALENINNNNNIQNNIIKQQHQLEIFQKDKEILSNKIINISIV